MASHQVQGYRPPKETNQRNRTGKPAVKNGRRLSGRSGRSNYRRKKKNSGKIRLIHSIILLVVVALLISGAMLAYAAYDEINSVEKEGTFYPGVYIDGYELHGATPQQAYDFLLEQARVKMTDWSIVLTYGGKDWVISTDMLGMSQALESLIAQEVNDAFQVGRVTDSTGLAGLIDRYRTVSALKSNPYQLFTTNVQRDEAAVDALLEEIKAEIDVEAVDATLMFNPDRQNPIIVTEEVWGRSLNISQLRQELIAMINRMEGGTIELRPDEIAPQFTAEQLRGQIVQLSSFSTEISTSSTEERNHNIEVGCSAFHGKVVHAGERVSFNSWTGKRTEENGYMQALEIVNGEYRMGYGGGICQVSSTLYNACVEAGLEIITRKNHGLAVNYIEMGSDATVADRGIDFVFKNNTGADIYLVARVVTSGNTKTCLFQVYGRPDPYGYTYELVHETVEVIPEPEVTPIPDRKAEYVIYTDQTKMTSKGHEGYVIRTYLITRSSNGTIINKEELYTDTYKAVPATVYVGVTPR